MNRFRAVQKGDYSQYGERHYTLYVEGYKYSIGNLKQDKDGRWMTYCGGRRDIAFHDSLRLLDVTYGSSAEALAAFRARYEQAEANAATVRAAAFRAIEGTIPEVEWVPNWSEETRDTVAVLVHLIYQPTETDSLLSSIVFEATVAETFAMLEHPDLNVNPQAFLADFQNRDGTVSRLNCYTKWFIPAYSNDYHLHNLGKSLSGRGSPFRRAA